MVFGKKKDEKKDAPKSDVPVQAVLSMKERAMTNEQVIEQLKSQGYNLQSIKDALTQADVKQSAISPALPNAPAPATGLPPLPTVEAPKEVPGLPASPARGGPGLNVAPSFGLPAAPKKESGVKVEEMERILEEIVDERWKDVTSKFTELESSKTKNETKVEELGKRVSELSSRLDEISSVVMGKVDEYKRTMEDVDIEIKALEKVMQKLVPSMAEQIKELKNVVGNLKGNTKPLE